MDTITPPGVPTTPPDTLTTTTPRTSSPPAPPTAPQGHRTHASTTTRPPVNLSRASEPCHHLRHVITAKGNAADITQQAGDPGGHARAPRRRAFRLRSLHFYPRSSAPGHTMSTASTPPEVSKDTAPAHAPPPPAGGHHPGAGQPRHHLRHVITAGKHPPQTYRRASPGGGHHAPPGAPATPPDALTITAPRQGGHHEHASTPPEVSTATEPTQAPPRPAGEPIPAQVNPATTSGTSSPQGSTRRRHTARQAPQESTPEARKPTRKAPFLGARLCINERKLFLRISDSKISRFSKTKKGSKPRRVSSRAYIANIH